MNHRLQHGLIAVLAMLLAGGALVNCGGGSNFNPPPNSIGASGGEASADVKTFRVEAVALQTRDELDVNEITLQYVLIASGVDGFTESKPDLSLEEAEKLAADVYKQAKAGADFDKLVLTHSYGRLISGQRPGMFTLIRGLGPDAVLTGGPNTFRREMEETAMWRAAWRLQPGEIGPVERHEKDANSGYYIVRRFTDVEIRDDNPANAGPRSKTIKTMHDDATALMARPEHGAKRVKVQHILIGRYFSDPNGKQKRLTALEAEELAAEVYAKAKAGDDFDTLVRTYTYDSVTGDPPGAYAMVADKNESTPQLTARDGMIPAFGDAAWRLEIGEVGVFVYHRARSFYGYHIIKRLE
jgi:hypothetical protein